MRTPKAVAKTPAKTSLGAAAMGFDSAFESAAKHITVKQESSTAAFVCSSAHFLSMRSHGTAQESIVKPEEDSLGSTITFTSSLKSQSVAAASGITLAGVLVAWYDVVSDSITLQTRGRRVRLHLHLLLLRMPVYRASWGGRLDRCSDHLPKLIRLFSALGNHCATHVRCVEQCDCGPCT